MKTSSVYVLALAALAISLLWAPRSFGDLYSFPGSAGDVVIPDGSTVTDAYVVEQYDPLPYNVVDFTLPDATGTVTGETDDVMSGFIDFTDPVTDVLLTWLGGPGTSVSANGSVVASCGLTMEDGCNETLNLGSDVVSQLSFYSYVGLAGIESVSYTPDPDPVPDHDPSVSWMLLGVPLMLGLSRLVRSKV